MPISDQNGYEKGHFKRVYEHLIIPSCKKAGFEPIRADDEAKTNFIVIDILKKILESEIVICDLSAKNPNVFYELGIRQAFNKKVVLIKDFKTIRPFDIQGLRSIDYDENLRIDSVQKSISEISNTIVKTYESDNDEINSLLQLLSIKPAKLTDGFELSNESSLLLKEIKDVQNRLLNLEINNNNVLNKVEYYEKVEDIYYKGNSYVIGGHIYINDEDIGEIVKIINETLIVRNSQNKLTTIDLSKADNKSIKTTPF